MFAATVSADAKYSQKMLFDFKAVLGGHSILNSFELGGVKLYDLTTLYADHVVVVLVFVVVLVMRAPIAEANLARQSRFGQEFQRAIDCGLPDGRVFLFDKLVKVFA